MEEMYCEDCKGVIEHDYCGFEEDVDESYELYECIQCGRIKRSYYYMVDLEDM